jgi:hypothetical protein
MLSLARKSAAGIPGVSASSAAAADECRIGRLGREGRIRLTASICCANSIGHGKIAFFRRLANSPWW